MADFTIDTKDLRKLRRSLKRAGVDYSKGTKRLLKEIGTRVHALAIKYAPRSPSKGQYERSLKGGKSRQAGIKFHPGQLERAITTEQKKNSVSIFVPSNSPAGKYAERIHDKKGSAWRKRGIGTVAKGAKADEKYIYRAYDDAKTDELIDKVINDLTGSIGI